MLILKSVHIHRILPMLVRKLSSRRTKLRAPRTKLRTFILSNQTEMTFTYDKHKKNDEGFLFTVSGVSRGLTDRPALTADYGRSALSAPSPPFARDPKHVCCAQARGSSLFSLCVCCVRRFIGWNRAEDTVLGRYAPLACIFALSHMHMHHIART